MSTSTSTTRQLLPIFSFLRILGRCPLTFEANPDHIKVQVHSENVHYKVIPLKWCLIPAFPAFCVISINIFGVFQSGGLSMQLVGPNKIWPDYISDRQPYLAYGEITTFFLSSFEIVTGVHLILDYFIAWASSRALVRTTIVVILLVCPTLFFGTSILFTGSHPGYPVAFCMEIVYSYISSICFGAEDVKTVIMFKAVEDSLGKVKKIVSHFLRRDKILGIPSYLKIEEVRKWSEVVVDIRGQSVLAGSYMGLQQLLSLLVLLYFLSAAIFVSARIIMGGHVGGESQLGMVLIFSITALFRLLAKIGMAGRITEKEHSLANLIKKAELREHDSLCRAELRSLYNMMVTRPAEISLNGYAVLNKALLLKIFGQAFTLIVVFMQLSNTPLS